jgi:hypothetical protein
MARRSSEWQRVKADEITDDFLKALEERLGHLPAPIEGQNRDASWMTAKEIKNVFPMELSSEALDSALLTRWEAGTSGKVRPAKYPHETDLFRLWGHEDVVRVRDRAEIEPRRLGSSVPLDRLDLPDDAPEVFLSFSSHDIDLALELRLFLGRLNIRAWLYQAVASKGLIIESVRAAICRCNAVIVLLTFSSLGSAWVYSEVHSAGVKLNKKIWAFVDSRDPDLITLIQSFDPSYNASLLQGPVTRLKQKYAQIESNPHRQAVYETVLKDQLTTIFYCYSGAALFPPRPALSPGRAGFSDANALAESLIRNSA